MGKTSNLKKGKAGIFIITIGIILVIYSLLMILLVVWGFNTSLKYRSDFHSPGNNVIGLPDFSWLAKTNISLFQNYIDVINGLEIKGRAESYYTIFSDEPVRHPLNADFDDVVWNTISYVIFSAIVQTLVPAVVGYMCAKYRYKFSEIVYVTALVIMMIPIVGTAPAELKLLKDLALYDTLIGNLIQKFNFTGMYFFVFYAFFQSVPDSYQEAAEIDGASQFRILTLIMMPLAIKMLSTVFLLRAVFYWNEYQGVLMYLPTRPTFAYAIYDLAFNNNQSGYGLQTTPARIAGTMLLTLPLLIVFIIFKDKLMGNVSLGGLKG